MGKTFLYSGIALLIAAVFAQQFGIDNDVGWGKGRILLFASGVILILEGVIHPILFNKLKEVENRLEKFINSCLSRSSQIILISFTSMLLVAVTYTWLIQLNTRDAAQEYNYYIELAKSFKMGKLYLAEQPSTALLSLENPYNYFIRREYNINDFPWDVSLYKNRFYIYWGPTPALLLSFLTKTQLSRIGDFHLALVFAYGLFIYSALMISDFWRRSLQNTPAWVLGLSLLAVGISAPVTVMLKGARIYEAAILGCQFFFIGGCYWAYSFIHDKKNILWKLALTSIYWAFAISTRIIVLPAVLFCALLMIVYILRVFKTDAVGTQLGRLATIAAPLVITGLGMAWYNWVRFDSIFEFGLTYQLANIDYTNFKAIFSIRNISQNIYLYFIHPLHITSRFPYISRIEYLPSNDRLAGLIYIFPYLLLLPLASLFRMSTNLWSSKKLSVQNTNKSPAENWVLFVLAGSGFISITIILSYYFVAMRFMEDFMPALMILTTIQVGREYSLLNQNQRVKKILIITFTLLAIVSIIANVLLGIPNSGTVFMINFLNTLSKLSGLR